MQNVLLLGSGMVSGPVVDYLTRGNAYFVNVASNRLSEAKQLTKNVANTAVHYVDLSGGGDQNDVLDALVQDNHLVISLLPLSYHVTVAKLCIAHRKSLVTASYTDPELRQLHCAALDAGITILNEMGLDPGMDHMLARAAIDEVLVNGGTVTGYTSYCGGIPSPDTDLTNNPLKYKFSWNPAGALFNSIRPARYLRNGQIVEVPSGGAALNHAVQLDDLCGLELVGTPNRDSLVYRDLYDVKLSRNFLRGSIRHKGHSDGMLALIQLGLIDERPHPALRLHGPEITWREFVCQLLDQPSDLTRESLRIRLLQVFEFNDSKVRAIEDLGLLQDEAVNKLITPLDTIADYLNSRLAYAPGERDMVILYNTIEIQSPSKHEVWKEKLCVLGDAGGYSAMAKCVGYTAALAAEMILKGELTTRGVIVPDISDIYVPILKRLALLGITSVRSYH